MRARTASHNQRANPEPPLRMPFGSDTVAAIEAKNAFVVQELARWQSVSVSTDFRV
jgi:hypothetical protein